MTPRMKGAYIGDQSQLSPGDHCLISACKITSHRWTPKVPLHDRAQPVSTKSTDPNYSSNDLPMPTWASRIMLTSFAPSPIAKVIGCSFENLINLTIWKRKKHKSLSSVWISLGLLAGQNQLRHTAGVGQKETTHCSFLELSDYFLHRGSNCLIETKI